MQTGVAASLVVVALASCSGGKDTGITDPPAGTTVVEMPGNAFSPPNAIIKVNGAVAFDFPGDEHDVTFVTKPGAPANIPITSRKIVTRTFSTVGVFPYDCKVHPGMSGQVTVNE